MSELVSVLTPSFNQAKWLGANLQSVAAQTYPDIEHIVADGGSTDGSVDLLRRAGHNLAWVSEADNGQSHALNKALNRSHGDIIGWINSDDAYFDSQAVSSAVAVFESNPQTQVVYSHAAVVNADNLVLQFMWAPPFDHRFLRFHNFIIQPTVFIRRSALGRRIANEAFQSSMDRELWLRLAAIGCHFSRINSVLAIDRHYPQRKALSRRDLAIEDHGRLRAAYGIPHGPAHDAQLKALTVSIRLLGAKLAIRQYGRPLAFSGHWDDRWRLLMRQIATRRSAMPGCGQRQGRGAHATG